MCEIYTFLVWESAHFSAFLSVHPSMQNLLMARVVFCFRYVNRLHWSHMMDLVRYIKSFFVQMFLHAL